MWALSTAGAGKKNKTLSLSEAVEANTCFSPKHVRPSLHRSCVFVASPKIKKRASENANVSEEQRQHVKGTLKDGRSGEIEFILAIKEYNQVATWCVYVCVCLTPPFNLLSEVPPFATEDNLFIH